MDGTKYVCKCRKVTFDDLENTVNEGASTVTEVLEKTKASSVCGRCKKEATEIAEHLIKKQKAQ